MSFEEEFAPESYDHTTNLSPKRYAVKSSVNTDLLKKENLKLIKDYLNDSDEDSDEDEKIRYLKLDLANKELEIIELKEKVSRLEKMNNVINEINTVLETVFKNNEEYEKLCDSMNSSNFRDIIKKEMQLIKPHSLPESFGILPLYIQTSCKYVYNIKNEVEKEYSTKIQDKIFYSNKFNEVLFYIQFALTIILALIYIYYFIKSN
jgi:hypothetical protein